LTSSATIFQVVGSSASVHDPSEPISREDRRRPVGAEIQVLQKNR
jgi:hypothetical protein